MDVDHHSSQRFHQGLSCLLGTPRAAAHPLVFPAIYVSPPCMVFERALPDERSLSFQPRAFRCLRLGIFPPLCPAARNP